MPALTDLFAASQMTVAANPQWWHLWATLALLALILFALVRNILPPDVAFLGGLVVVVALRIITPEQAFHGLSNHGLVTVGAMFVVAAGLRETGALHMFVSRVLGNETTLRTALARLVFPAAGMSAFVNNTPIVAMLIPEVLSWSRKRNISASKLLMPLSYATILGGVCTLIGTSTNLVIDGMMRDSGLAPMSLFELGQVGVPVALVGLGFVLLIAYHFLPDRKELIAQLGESQREYIVELMVQLDCPLIGRSVQDAGLRRLPGLFLIEIDRGGAVISPVAPTEVLEVQDRLIFTGLVSTIMELQRIPGLAPASDTHYELSPSARRTRRMCEAVVSNSFPSLGKNIRESDFRTRFDAVVVAVHRNGERLRKKIGDIVLRPGDTLLLQTGPHFERTFRGSSDFYLVSEVQGSAPTRHDRAWIALGILALLVVLLTSTFIPTAVAALIAAGLMVACRCVSVGAAREAVNWQVLLVIAAALGFGQAVQSSGLAGMMAEGIIDVGKQVAGPAGVLVGIYLLTNILTEIISHIGAAAVVFPIAMASAAGLGVDPRPFAITIAVAASASFATPIGYQTNLMVYGPGGYRFTDFLRVGLPLNLLVMICSVLIIPQVWPFR